MPTLDERAPERESVTPRRDDPQVHPLWKFAQPGQRAWQCWDWAGAHTAAGYGTLREGGRRGGRQLYAHRVAYELLRGDLVEGFQIDHLCRNKGCINPNHLEQVTPTENAQRAPGHAAHEGMNRTHCGAGHLLDEINSYRRPGRPWVRVCRVCVAERNRARRAKAAA